MKSQTGTVTLFLRPFLLAAAVPIFPASLEQLWGLDCWQLWLMILLLLLLWLLLALEQMVGTVVQEADVGWAVDAFNCN